MAGIGGHRDDNPAAFWKNPNAAGPDVILHVARALSAGGIEVAFEFREDLRQRLADHVGEHAEPPPVRHPDDDLLDAIGGSPGQQLLQDGDGGLRPFQREALLAHEAGVQEMLELLGLQQTFAGSRTRVPRSSGQLLASGSMRCCSQRFCSGCWMFMYSQPIFPQ